MNDEERKVLSDYIDRMRAYTPTMVMPSDTPIKMKVTIEKFNNKGKLIERIVEEREH